jgi:hypothetical protein
MDTSGQDQKTAKSAFQGPIYTTGEYWGGHVMPYWIWLLFAIFPLTGFFGIDHLLFRSPTTAVYKGLTNIATLGLWYFYDIIQGLGNREYVKEYGLSKPFGGPAGLAYEYFSGVHGKDTRPKSTIGILQVLRFMIFCFVLFVPFGASNFLAGDTSGAMLKIIWSLLLLFVGGLFIIPIVGGVNETFRLFIKPTDLYEKGASRMPLDYLPRIQIDSYGLSSALMTPAAYTAAAAEKEKANQGFFKNLLASFQQLIGVAKQVPAVGAVIQGAETAAEGVGAGLAAAGTSVKKLGETTAAAMNTAGSIVQTAAKVAPVAAAALTQGPAVLASAAQEKLQEATVAAEAPIPKTQAGGAVNQELRGWDGLVVGGIGLLAFGGIATSLFRNAFRETYDTTARVERNNNDTPPRPGIL